MRRGRATASSVSTRMDSRPTGRAVDLGWNGKTGDVGLERCLGKAASEMRREKYGFQTWLLPALNFSRSFAMAKTPASNSSAMRFRTLPSPRSLSRSPISKAGWCCWVWKTIVNALVHRDYLLSSTDIELSIYEDRMEVVSPGRLPNGITPVRMLTGCRAARNQLIKDVMRDYRYLEHSGMGVPRKIVKSMKEHNGTAPVLIEDGERFTMRLLR